MHAVERANKIESVGGEKPPVERAGKSGQAHGRRAPSLQLDAELEFASEVRKGQKDGIEVIGREVVEEDHELRCRRCPLLSPLVDGTDDFADKQQGISPRRATEIDDREPLSCCFGCTGFDSRVHYDVLHHFQRLLLNKDKSIKIKGLCTLR